MLTAAINFWLLPATLFLDTLTPPPKPVLAEAISFSSSGQRIRRKRKVLRSMRGG